MLSVLLNFANKNIKTKQNFSSPSNTQRHFISKCTLWTHWVNNLALSHWPYARWIWSRSSSSDWSVYDIKVPREWFKSMQSRLLSIALAVLYVTHWSIWWWRSASSRKSLMIQWTIHKQPLTSLLNESGHLKESNEWIKMTRWLNQ